MYCPFCRATDTKVVDSRLIDEGTRVKRRRACLECEERFTTFEELERLLPRVVKRDGASVSFNRDKLRMSMVKALEKRPVSVDQIERALEQILKELQVMGDAEVHSRDIGELVMGQLRELDQVAYVRFASIYRSFQDVEAFHEEIRQLKEKEKMND